MFVLQSTYDRLQVKYLILSQQFEMLKRQWNELVNEVNRKGGRQFLDGKAAELDDGDLRTLIKLCHPDKHDGASDAHVMTVKLLAMRTK